MIPERYGVINRDFLEVMESNPTARKFAFYGGGGSGKSCFVGQYLCKQFIDNDNIKILNVRKWLPALKISSYQLIVDILTDWGFPVQDNHNKTDHIITRKNSRIHFSGLDNPEKLKSAEWDIIWIEEATDLTPEDFLQLKIRLGRSIHSKSPKLIFTFNPVDQYHWLITDVIQRPDKVTVIHHSTYHDNYRNLSKEFIDELERLAEFDENHHRVYCLGLPGVLKNIIYTNYAIENFSPDIDPDFYGLDFGFTAPMAMSSVKFRDEQPYITELLYQTGMTTRDLIAWMNANGIRKKIPIYADSAEPDRIQEIKEAGYNIKPAKKDVVAGIDRVKSYKQHINSNSSNMISEIRAYKYRETKDGHVFEEPVPFRDHLMDCNRYGIFTSRGPVKKKKEVEHVSSRAQTSHLFKI